MDKDVQNSLLRLYKLGFLSLKNILDIGAHHGYQSLSSRQVFPNANYMLIESIKYIELSNCCDQISNFNYKIYYYLIKKLK